jgi:hypothetical protein
MDPAELVSLIPSLNPDNTPGRLTHLSLSVLIPCYFSNHQVSDKMDPAELVSLIASLNPDNTPGRLAVIVRMGAEKLRAKFPALIEAVEQAGQVRGMHLMFYGLSVLCMRESCLLAAGDVGRGKQQHLYRAAQQCVLLGGVSWQGCTASLDNVILTAAAAAAVVRL